MTVDKKYRAFLSYSHQDRKWADRLHRELERYRIPKHLFGAGISDQPSSRYLRPVFRDRDELSSGSSLPQVIQQALKDSDALIVICSPSAVASTWVNDEIKTFQRLGRGDRIFCLIVDGIPLGGDGRECFPDALIHPVDAQGRTLLGQEEPIAADVRGGKSDWRHAKLMLIAGLLGVGLDKLLQRDQQRRNRKLLSIAVGSVIITLVMAGLTIFAFLSQAEAERRRADAENLVGFLLGDLREDLHAIGRVDLYGSVAEKAMEYFQSLEKEEARDEVLAQRAEALRQIGSALLERSDMAGAMRAFEESLTIIRQLVEQSPTRADWGLALAKSYFHIGEVYWQSGNLEAASTEFLNQLSLVDALSAALPENIERLEHSGYAWTNYGRVMELGGQYDKALQAYQTVMDTFQRLLLLQPESTNARLEVGFAHNNLGKLKTSLGLLEEAEVHYREDLQIKKEIAEDDPSNNLWREYLAYSHIWLGKLLAVKAKLAEAAVQNNLALELLDSLLINDPELSRLRQRKAGIQTELAAICRLNGEAGCALANIERAMATLTSLIGENPENEKWLRDRCWSELEAAWQADIRGQSKLAFSYTRNAKTTVDQLIEQAPLDHELRKLEVMVMLTLGDLSNHAAEPAKAAITWQSALSTLNEMFKATRDPQVLDLFARLLARNELESQAHIARKRNLDINYVSSYPWP